MSDTITTREFAHDNNLNVRTLRGFIQYDELLRPAFSRGNVHYYKLDALTNWLKKNIKRFDEDNKRVSNQSIDFFCNGSGKYKPIELRRKNGCCVDCREKAKNRVIAIDKNVDEGVRVHTVKVRIDDIIAQRALKDDISGGWMLRERL